MTSDGSKDAATNLFLRFRRGSSRGEVHRARLAGAEVERLHHPRLATRLFVAADRGDGARAVGVELRRSVPAEAPLANPGLLGVAPDKVAEGRAVRADAARELDGRERFALEGGAEGPATAAARTHVTDSIVSSAPGGGGGEGGGEGGGGEGEGGGGE
eukprot:CAMPEP_0170142922 /NCGR_PEP_ID=MMETSP0033_2-20121228/9114_1 /TAXON_ID=195969 /ORGANISM="Dolichomastix tenuilepis, Strain CCMP3274" /LENGTH=157 /DNA_ID=CAMNT_0010379327 /DNA_START=289 /DNA_END=761 /DNA_ORIENTATION=-